MTAGVVTLSAIRTAAQQRADMVGSTFVSNAEWLGYINASLCELYDLILQKYGNNWYVSTPATISTDGTNDQYSLATDFYHLLGVDLQLAGTAGAANGQYISLYPFNFIDRNKFALPNLQNWNGRSNLRYRLSGSNPTKLWLSPFPASGQTIRYWYAPRLAALVNDADQVDGVSGWEEYVVVDAAKKALQKEESDVAALAADKALLIKRIDAAADNRDAGSPMTVSDSRRDEWGGGGGPYGGGNW